MEGNASLPRPWRQREWLESFRRALRISPSSSHAAARDAAGDVGGAQNCSLLSGEGLGVILPSPIFGEVRRQWNSEGECARGALGRSRRRTPSSSAFGIVGHLDCRRACGPSAEELTLLFVYCRDHPVAKCVRCAGKFHLREVASIDQFGIRSHGCPWCHTDLTNSIRAHLSFAKIPSTVKPLICRP